MAWYKSRQSRLFIVVSILIVLLIVSFFIPILFPFRFAFLEYFRIIWWALLIGFLLAGLIDYFIPKEFIYKYLGHERKAIFFSVFLGFLMAACSHGILAISMQLYKKGASTPAVIAFLMASPWANLPITILLFAFFGWKGLLFVLAALTIAIITGFIYQGLDKKCWIECKRKEYRIRKVSVAKHIKTSLKRDKAKAVGYILHSSWQLMLMILWWILIGIIIASLARAFVPTTFFQRFMGPTTVGLFVTLAFATIIEVCSEGSSPMAFEIFRQTAAFGNPFVFLMAGVATDYTEIGLIWQNIGKKAAIWLPIVTVPQILLIGWLFNIIL